MDFAITAINQKDAADRIAHTKERKYSVLCEKEGWQFVPVVGDSFGAVREASAKFLSTLCRRVVEKAEPGQWPLPQTLFWQSVSTCLVTRASGAIAEAWAQNAAAAENLEGLVRRTVGVEAPRDQDQGKPPDPPNNGGGGEVAMGVEEGEEDDEVEEVVSKDPAGINNAQPLGLGEEAMPVAV